jgi:hypothetical protein
LRLSLVELSINQVRGSQIAKTKLPIRKAQERHGKKGQKGRKKAPQTPTSATFHASDRDEVSDYDQTRKDAWTEAKRRSDEAGSTG